MSDSMVKSHATSSNELFTRVSELFESKSGDVKNEELVKFINGRFLWEQINYMLPLEPIFLTQERSEWRLLYQHRKRKVYMVFNN